MGRGKRFASAAWAGVFLFIWIGLLVARPQMADAGLANQRGANESSAIRVIHGIGGAGPLDIYVDGAIALIGIGFADVSAELALAAGDHAFAVVPSGAELNASLIEGRVTLDAGTSAYAALLGTVDTASVGLYAIDDRPLDTGAARVRIVSGAVDADGIVPAFTGGDALSQPLGFGDATQYAVIDAGSYDLEFLDVATGSVLLTLAEAPLAAGSATDIFLIGQVSDGTLQALTAGVPLAISRAAGQAASIYSGLCDAPGERVADLGLVRVGQGASVGVERTPAVSQGYSLAAVPFSVLTDSPHSIHIHDSAQLTGTSLACGEIGGALVDTGALVIVLGNGADDGIAGIAVLAPALEDPESTGVSIFFTGAGSGSATNGPETAPAEDAE
jgi:hypothetical protein